MNGQTCIDVEHVSSVDIRLESKSTPSTVNDMMLPENAAKPVDSRSVASLMMTVATLTTLKGRALPENDGLVTLSVVTSATATALTLLRLLVMFVSKNSTVVTLPTSIRRVPENVELVNVARPGPRKKTQGELDELENTELVTCKNDIERPVAVTLTHGDQQSAVTLVRVMRADDADGVTLSTKLNHDDDDETSRTLTTAAPAVKLSKKSENVWAAFGRTFVAVNVVGWLAANKYGRVVPVRVNATFWTLRLALADVVKHAVKLTQSNTVPTLPVSVAVLPVSTTVDMNLYVVFSARFIRFESPVTLTTI